MMSTVNSYERQQPWLTSVIGCCLSLLIGIVGCKSTAPITAPISGQSFSVLTIDGRPLPTTVFLPGRGTCGAQGVISILLVFSSDGSFVEAIGTTESSTMTITGSYAVTQTSSVALVNGKDTATVIGDTLRVRLSGANCGGEELVAVRRV